MNIQFYRFTEKKPSHGENIVYFNALGSFNSLEFNPKQSMVECMWEVLDPDDGLPTGTTITYSPGDGTTDTEECRLVYTTDTDALNENCWWVNSDQLFDIIDQYYDKADVNVVHDD